MARTQDPHDLLPLTPPVFMTSLNYPGVYGGYYYGPGASMTPIASTAVQLSIAREEVGRLARIELRVPATRMLEIVNGRRGITADTALRLARYFDTTPKFWLNLQSSYDLAMAESKQEEIARTVHDRIVGSDDDVALVEQRRGRRGRLDLLDPDAG